MNSNLICFCRFQLHELSHFENIYRERERERESAPENLTVFEILKPACPLRSASLLTAIVHSAVWSLVDMGMYLSVLIIFSTLL
jgi:hypothetical protein